MSNGVDHGVIITQWATGFSKLSMGQILYGMGGWGLAEIASAANTIVAGGEVTLRLDSEKQAGKLIEEIEALGGSARPYTQEQVLCWSAAPEIVQRNSRLWRAKLIKGSFPSIEIRRASMVVVVSLGEGYEYKAYKPEKTQGVNVHLSSAGAQQLNFDEWDELFRAVGEAKERLKSLAHQESSRTANMQQ